MPDIDLIAAFRADAAPPSDEVRAQARGQLLGAIAETPTRRLAPLRLPSRGWLALAAALGAVAIVMIAAPWQTAGRDDIARAAAMVALKPGTVLHVRADGHKIYTPFSEQWIAPDGSWRDEHGGSSAAGPCTVEGGFNAATHVLSVYDAPTRTVYSRHLGEAMARLSAYPDQIAQVRAWLAAGQLHGDGEARIDGRRVTRLVPTHGQRLRGVKAYYVDARTSAPVRWQLNAAQWYDFTVYERLPATAANLALTSIRAQHPEAALRRGWGRRGGCGSG
jgi:hypothetical protein